MSRRDQFLVTAVLDGEATGVWDDLSGGNAGAESTKTRTGGMGPLESLGGPQTLDNLTLTRLFKAPRDTPLAKKLLPRRGRARATITKQPLDIDGAVSGAPFVYGGTVLEVLTPEPDANSNERANLQVVVELDQAA